MFYLQFKCDKDQIETVRRYLQLLKVQTLQSEAPDMLCVMDSMETRSGLIQSDLSPVDREAHWVQPRCVQRGIPDQEP